MVGIGGRKGELAMEHQPNVSATLTISYWNKAGTPNKVIEIDPCSKQMPKVGLCPKCGGIRLKKRHILTPLDMKIRTCPFCKERFVVGVSLRVVTDLGWIVAVN
jgi:hypothetical protein